MLSKAKYESLVRSTCKQYSDAAKRTQHLQLCNGVPVDKLLSYKELIKNIKRENIGELLPFTDTRVSGLYRPLKSLVMMMAELFTSSARLLESLTWFGQPNTFFTLLVVMELREEIMS